MRLLRRRELLDVIFAVSAEVDRPFVIQEDDKAKSGNYIFSRRLLADESRQKVRLLAADALFSQLVVW